MSVKIAIQITSTKCQYRAHRSTAISSDGWSPRLKSIASSVSSQSTPALTCAPWNPVSVKKVEPNRLRLIVSPSFTNAVNSYAWNPRNVAPSNAVTNSQSFDEPRMRSPAVCLGTFLFCTAASASTIASDDISSTNVEADVTGMSRIPWYARPVTGSVHGSCGNGPTTLFPL